MKTKLLHQFRKEFTKSIKLEVHFHLSGYLSMEIITPFWGKSIGSFIRDTLQLDPSKVGSILTYDDYQQLVDKIFDAPNKELEHLYHKFMLDRIQRYKKEHPYKGVRIRVFYRKRR